MRVWGERGEASYKEIGFYRLFRILEFVVLARAKAAQTLKPKPSWGWRLPHFLGGSRGSGILGFRLHAVMI